MSAAAGPSVGSSHPSSSKPQLEDYYLWEEPERGIRIYSNLATVDRLQLEVLRGIDGFPSDEVEVGGILLGRTELDGERAITLIEDFVTVPCSYRSGPLYRLSEKDAVKFETVLARCSSDPRGLSVIGYYRSHNRDNLYLSSDDLNLIQQYFSEPDKIFLLIKTLPSKACTAGFFFWEDGHIQTEFTYLEVPLGPLSFPVAEPVLPATVRVDDRLTPAAKDLHKKRPTVQSLRVPESVRHPRRVWLVRGSVVTVAAAVVTLTGLNYWQSRRAHPPETASTSLGLHVQRQPGSLALTWNPNSRDLIGAEAAILYINEGNNQRALHLDPSQLRRGEVSFAPSSDDIELRFEIDRSGKPSAAEKVHLLLPIVPGGVSAHEGTPSSTNTEGLSDLKRKVVAKESPARSEKSSQASLAVLTPSSREREPSQQTAQLTSPADSPRRLRFVAPTSNSIVSAKNDVQIEQPPSIPTETKISGLMVTAPVVTAAAPPNNPTQSVAEQRTVAQNQAPPAPVLTGASGQAGPSRQPQVTSFVGPHLIRQVDPVIPFALKSRITPDLEIEVAVTIDVNGKVTDAKVASTKGAAARFVSDDVLQAARLFLFRPAQDNHRSVESKMLLTFRFSSGATK
jgi:hypothetical protein